MQTRIIVSGIVKHGEEYLLLKRSLNNYSPNDWEFVTGFIEEKETSESAVLREIREETGLDGIIEKAYSPLEIFGRNGRYIFIPYLVQVPSQEVTLSEEHTEYFWTNKDKLLNYKGTVKELVELLG